MIFKRCGSAAPRMTGKERSRTHWARDDGKPRCGTLLPVDTGFDPVEVSDPDKLFFYMDCERCLKLAKRALKTEVAA